MRLNQQIQQKFKYKSPYRTIAERHGVSYDYVTRIAAGSRQPTKKKGLAVLNDLHKLVNAGK